MNKFYIKTLGCKVNLYESNYIKESLTKMDFLYVEDFKEANIIILNTCSVTNNADSKSLKELRKFRRLNKKAYIAVCGCSVQNNYSLYKDLDINLILGNDSKMNIPNMIKDNYLMSNKLIHLEKPSCFVFEDTQIDSFSNTRAYIKIQDGCNNFCSYCIIPYLRGSMRNKPFDSVIKEATQLVNSNFKEIVLTGINTGSYNDEGKDLTDLINELSKINDLKRIRVSSIEVTEITDKFITMLENNNKVCNHLHIPLQSGSDYILKSMNRKYNTKYFANKIKKIKKVRKDISITTDIIVGFPGETETHFKEMIDFVNLIKFSDIHVFPFSKRTGTRASKLSNQVNGSVIKKRSLKLISLSEKLKNEYNKKFLGKELLILIETTKNDFSYGHSDNFINVKIPSNHKINEFIKLKLKDENLV